MATELIGPNPDEMKEGETYKVVKEGDKLALRKTKERLQERHITTIAGPQAEAIIQSVSIGKATIWRNKSVQGLAVVELWQDYNPNEEVWAESDD